LKRIANNKDSIMSTIQKVNLNHPTLSAHLTAPLPRLRLQALSILEALIIIFHQILHQVLNQQS
jgi:hypothetical protein